MSDDLAYAPATDLAARIRRRDLSPVELLDAVITRIETRNPQPERTRLHRLRRGP
jgi:amidase